MKVELLQPDVSPAAPPDAGDARGFASALDAVGSLLQDATAAEDAFAGGSGSLQAAMIERAKADVALSVATATAQRAAQALNGIFNLQI